MTKIFKYSLHDLVRGRGSLIYLVFYLLTTGSLLYLTDSISQVVVNLMNIVIILSPLIGMLMGVVYYYSNRDFIELLLALPIKRADVFLGQYLGLASTLSLGMVLGMALPFTIYRIPDAESFGNLLTVLVVGVILTFIFCALAFYISMNHENKIRGFSMAIIVWLILAVVYDGFFLLTLIWFNEYPLEKLAILMTLLNPIDLCRTLILLKLDISALMGYTGAVFKNFFGTAVGTAVGLTVALIWIGVPLALMRLRLGKKDF